MFVVSLFVSVILYLFLKVMYVLLVYILYFRDWELFLYCRYYFFLFFDKKDNRGFLKYVFVRLSINLVIFLVLEIFFIIYNEFICYIFR